jgi:high-affinity iron transporter
MFSTAIVIFRETIEIAMILGIVLAATRALPRRMPWILGGFAGGAAGAGLVALLAESIAAAVSGVGQELFNAGVLFAAASMIGWTLLWMHRHARELSAHMRQVGHDVTTGGLPLYTLSVIIGLSMLREGAEIVMFVYGMLLSGQSGTSIISGAAGGVTCGAAIGVMLYYGLLRMPARYALKVTGWLLMLLVSGLMSQGAAFLSAAGCFADWSQPVWDSSWLLAQEGVAGKTLHSLIGYTATPTPVQLLFYGATLAGLLCLMSRTTTPARGKTPGQSGGYAAA